jgi:hypothetical protein
MSGNINLRAGSFDYLVVWRGFPTEDVTGEGEHILQHPDLELHKDKQSQKGRIVMYSSN